MLRLPNRLARRLALAGAGLCGAPALPAGPARSRALVEALGYVQIDSIRWVERAHHMILFARDRAYRQGHLDRLLERDRALFEHWTHDAAAIPIALYPHWKRRFGREAARLRARWVAWQGGAFLAELDRLRDRLAREGPLAAEDLERPEGLARGGLWAWSPQKTAVEFLWRTGEVAVARRAGFRKVYDLAARVHPGPHAAAPAGEAEHRDWAVRGALDRLQFATAGEIADFWSAVGPDEVKAAAPALGLVTVEVEGADGRPRRFLAPPDLAERAAAAPEPPQGPRILSPFDPLHRNRGRALHLFGFDYRIEIFVPAARRRWGYYVFPVLERDRYAGRIDMKADRAADRLRVTAFWPEPGFRPTRRRLAALERALARQARFAGCAGLDFAPGWLREPGRGG